MSRPQGHRKSQSTSALNVLAAGSSSSHLSQSTATATPRASKRPVNRLNAVVEDEGVEVSTRSPGIEKDIAALQHAIKNKKTGHHSAAPRSSSSKPPDAMDEVKAAINDIRSLRSSDRRRFAAVRKLERTVVLACAQTSAIALPELLNLQVHLSLTAVLSRHAQTLSSRASRSETTLPASDDMANTLKPELSSIALTLQGLCLVDRRAKEELGQSWMLELIIDLLLILRAQTALDGERPIVYLLLDLLCCILVDSPSNSRVFESLDGLEGVVRVLKGTGVPKEVRMKCIEFLYFYLLPENTQEPQRATSAASSSSSTSSASSQLYPPRDAVADTTPTPSPTTPSRRKQSVTTDQPSFQDLDIPFVPQTPQKRPEPSLGYLTPSTRRISSSFTSTPSRSIPPSPRHVPPSPSHQPMPPSPSLRSTPQPASQTPVPASPSRRRLSIIEREGEANNSGLGLGLPRSSTALHLSRRTSIKRDVTAIKLSETELDGSGSSGLARRTTDRTATHSSSGSSTVTPSVHSRGISRSSTQTGLASGSSAVSRVPSIKRATRQSEDDTPQQSDVQPRPPKIRHSRTSAQLSSLAADLPRPASEVAKEVEPRLSKVRHSSTSAQLSDLARGSDSRAPQPAMSRSVATNAPMRTPSPNTSMPPPPVPKPTPRKGFPAGITKGLPSAVSSPNLNSPLGPSKRIPSGRLSDKRSSSKLSEVRSVEEKKELLGKWVGNVDALVEGVEKVSFWGTDAKKSTS